MSDVVSSAGGAGPRAGMPLFVYGTLRFTELVHALLGREPPCSPAAVVGWRVAALPGRAYPGLVPAAGTARAAGRLLSGLTAAEWAVLDAFEGDEYELRRLALAGAGGGSALAYAWRDVPGAGEVDWDPERFAAEHLDSYVRLMLRSRSSRLT